MYNPAYTTVSARTSFGPPPPAMAPPFAMPAPGQALPLQQPPPPPPPPQQAPGAFPDSVRDYVRRAFAEENSLAGVSLTDLQAKLRDIISAAAQNKQINSIDWYQVPLPQQMIQAERMNGMFQPPNPQGFTPVSVTETNPRSHDNVRKRKSGSLDLDNDYSPTESSPPWRTTKSQTETTSLDSRITYPSKRQKAGMNLPTQALTEKEKRKQRFQSKGAPTISRELDPELVTLGPVIGRSQTLEKRYLRLTSAPNPEMVRPLHILQQTLDLLKRKWRQDGNYTYICDQFKSLRQDLTVQHIKNEFTVNVYEIHARIALEKGDLGEYNQCQTQLQALYAQNLGGHPVEFKAYRILYFLFTCSRSDMNDVLADLTQAERKEPAIKHALAARSALALGNYHRFFRLYVETPNMGAYLMDKFVARERLAALANLCKAYKPDIKLRFVAEELGFDSDPDAAQFICEHGDQSFLHEVAPQDVRFLTGKVGNVFDEARKRAFGTVDLKGQIY